MVDHLVLFKWKPDASPDAIARVAQELKALRTTIPGIVDLTLGTNFSARAQGYHMGLFVRFADRAALDAYVPHPAHQDVVQNFIAPIREDTLVVDYEW